MIRLLPLLAAMPAIVCAQNIFTLSEQEALESSSFSWDGFYWSNGSTPSAPTNVVLGEIIGPGGEIIDHPTGDVVSIFLESPVTIASLQTFSGFDLSTDGHNLTVTGSSDLEGFLNAIGSRIQLGDLQQFDASTGTFGGGGYLITDSGGSSQGVLEFEGADIIINNTALNLFGTNTVIRDQNTGLDALRNFARNQGALTLDDGASVMTSGDFDNTASGKIILNLNVSPRVPVFTVSGNLRNDGVIELLGNTSFSVAGAYSGNGTIQTRGINNQISVIGAYIQDAGDLEIADGDDLIVGGDLELNGNLRVSDPGSKVTVGGDLRGNGSLIIMKGDGTEIVVTGDILQTGGKVDTGPSGVDASILRARAMTYQNNACISGEGRLITGGVNVNNSFLTPGNTPGHLAIEGDLAIIGSSDLEIELGGTVQGESYDLLSQSGGTTGITLGGTLTVKLVDDFECDLVETDSFTVVTSDIPLGGAFTNVSSGSRLATTDGIGTFLVTYGTGSGSPSAVVLSDFEAAPVTPITFAEWSVEQGFPSPVPGGDQNDNGIPDVLEYTFGSPSGTPCVYTTTVDGGAFVWTFGIPKYVTGVTVTSITFNDLPPVETNIGPAPVPAGSTASMDLYTITDSAASLRNFYQLRVVLDD